jgi:hypothetical protein
MMNILQKILQILDSSMETPTLYGWFHILFLVITVGATVVLCCTHKKRTEKQVENLVFGTAIIVTIFEIYKVINFSVSYTDGISFDFPWYIFPWQFCSTPMYVGLLTGFVKNKKVKDSLYAFLATYAVFAGISVMVYPISVFIDTIGINIQTMFCHGSMIVIGCYLLYSGKVKIHIRSLWKAVPVFGIAVGIAVILNEIAYYSGLLETDSFNMFYISPYCDPHLPVYSLVQQVVPFPWCLIIYIVAFTLAAGVILCLAKGIAYISERVNKKK